MHRDMSRNLSDIAGHPVQVSSQWRGEDGMAVHWEGLLHLCLNASVLYERPGIRCEAAHGHADVGVHLCNLLYARRLLKRSRTNVRDRGITWALAPPSAGCMQEVIFNDGRTLQTDQ